MTGPSDVPRMPRRRGLPAESPASGVTIFSTSGWIGSRGDPTAEIPPVLIEDADPGLARLSAGDYVAAMCAKIAAEMRIPDRYVRPTLPTAVEGRFLADLPRLMRWMILAHYDDGPIGQVAWDSIMATLADLSGAG